MPCPELDSIFRVVSKWEKVPYNEYIKKILTIKSVQNSFRKTMQKIMILVHEEIRGIQRLAAMNGLKNARHILNR